MNNAVVDFANDTFPRTRLPIAKPRAVLNEAEAIAIFQLRPRSDLTRVVRDSLSVAQAYNVSEKTIRDIWSARTWHRETLHLDPSRPVRADTLPGRPLGRKDSAPRRRPIPKSKATKLPAATDADDPFHDDWPNWERADHFSEQLMPISAREVHAPAAKRPRSLPTAHLNSSPTQVERAKSVSSPVKAINRAKDHVSGDDCEVGPSPLLPASCTPFTPPIARSPQRTSATPIRPQAPPSWHNLGSALQSHPGLPALNPFPRASAGPQYTRLAGLQPPPSSDGGNQTAATTTAAAAAAAAATHRLRGVEAVPRLSKALQWSLLHPSPPPWHAAPPSPRRRCLNGACQCEAPPPPPPPPP